jgi:hypothetical protein
MNVLPKTLRRQDWVPKITFLVTNFILVNNVNAMSFGVCGAYTNAQRLNSTNFYYASVSTLPLISLNILSNHTFVNIFAKQDIEKIIKKSNINGIWKYIWRNISSSVLPQRLFLRRTPVSIFLQISINLIYKQ